MEKKMRLVPIETVRIKSPGPQYQIVQLFSAQNVKNKKVDPINLPIYTI
jgi:hypothetical protein